LGWYGHKASVRIKAWGEKMNERDAIFESVAALEEMSELRIEPNPFVAVAGNAEHPIPVSMAALN
jgi:hypothetical protein